MIKGVNKKIIEINNPDSQYFDKVILYIKPNREIQSSNELSYEVDKYLKSIIKDKNKKKHNDNLDINNTIGFIVGMAIVLIIIIVLILI